MKVLNIFFIVSLTYLIMSCAPFSIDYDYDRDINFAKLRTFDFLPVKVKTNELVIKHFERAVNRELEAKGFMKNQANPDFLIAIHSKKVKKRGVIYDPVVYNSVRRSSFRITNVKYKVYIYKEGTYTLTIRDSQSEEVIWMGTAKDELDYNPSAEEQRQRINITVAKILNNFPPPKE